MTWQTLDEVLNNWIDSVRTTMDESQKGTHTPTKLLADPETKIKMGWGDISCRPGQDSLEAERQQPNSPLGDRNNDDL